MLLIRHEEDQGILTCRCREALLQLTYHWRKGMKKQRIMVLAIVGSLIGMGAAFQAQEKTPEVVTLKGNPMGGVKFNHAAHVKRIGDKCETCHHASKPEKALKTPHENCQNCHTRTVAAPMKTASRAAFHDGPAKKGTCIDCHIKEAAAKKAAPLKCAECHKKENV